MIVAAAFFIAFLLLFGLLALPYSLVITGGSWLVGAGTFALIVARNRAQTPLALGTIVVMCLIGVLAWNFILMPWVNQPVIREVTRLNPDGEAGRAFVVYHPGRSDLQEQAVTGYVDGLVDAGWQVDLTTASEQTPADLTDYDLLVVGAQSYTWAPARPVQDYLRRVGDLDSLPVIAILSGLGETGPANDVMRDLIEEVNGEFMTIHNIWQLRPIDDLYGTDDPYDAMRQMAQQLEAEVR